MTTCEGQLSRVLLLLMRMRLRMHPALAEASLEGGNKRSFVRRRLLRLPDV